MKPEKIRKQIQNTPQSPKGTNKQEHQRLNNYIAHKSGKWASTRSALETPDVGGMV